ncbi:MAG: hypothetical protein AAGD25_33070 [Cyanobacteria bacterium P01_F01_bin.150]
MARGPKLKPISAESTNKKRVRFIFEPDRASPNGITFHWLIHKAYGGKNKAASATRAFWLPFAYKESGDYSEAELKEVAQQSVRQMEEQIQHIRETFELDMPGRTTSPAIQPSVIVAQQTSTSASVSSPISASVNDGDMLDDFSDAL